MLFLVALKLYTPHMSLRVLHSTDLEFEFEIGDSNHIPNPPNQITSVPLKKIVSCIFIDSLCLYHEFYVKFLFHIANSLCQKL